MAHCQKTRRNGGGALVVPGGTAGALISGLCGLSITLCAMVVAVIPPPGTHEVWLHETKLVGGSLFLIAIGLFIYRRAKTMQLRIDEKGNV
jgi:hypothetical protein